MEKIYKKDINKVMPILQALVKGKTIQINEGAVWKDIDIDVKGIDISTLIECPECYRVKQEPKYRPFKDAEECWQEMQKHKYFGWVKIDDWYCTIKEIRPTCIFCYGGGDVFYYEDVVKQITFIDGTPFGIKEEE